MLICQQTSKPPSRQGTNSPGPERGATAYPPSPKCEGSDYHVPMEKWKVYDVYVSLGVYPGNYTQRSPFYPTLLCSANSSLLQFSPNAKHPLPQCVCVESCHPTVLEARNPNRPCDPPCKLRINHWLIWEKT